MGGGQRVHVVGFAIGRALAMEIFAVPGRYSRFIVKRILFGIVPDTANLIGIANFVFSA